MNFFVFFCSSVLDVVIEELKKILKRDFNKRMIEATAFKAFETWWDEQERSFKVKLSFYLVVNLFINFFWTKMLKQQIFMQP